MATTSKLSFRARNLDASKSMPVYCADELPDLAECTPINRAVAQMPTGMEKDEENESHLQEAILAQQASTSGIAVENHVIPTPKVFPVDHGHYDALYPVQPAPSINQLIKVQASLSLGNEEPEYDIDSDDEAWLAERGGHIMASDFEKMMELLEGASSPLQICQPGEARVLLKDFDMDLVDDVYDYWLQKRKDAAASRKIASLIPRVKTDIRRDASGSDIAYVAFRRRLERMQTRKNRKNDEDSYEKILKLGHDLSRAVILFDMLRRREHTKQAIIELDNKLCRCRWEACDFGCILYNQSLAKVKLDRNAAMSPVEESQDEMSSGSSPTKVKGHKRKRHSRNSMSEADKDLINRAWLRKNAELWNKPATAASVLSAGASPSTTSAADAEANAEASIDGRYSFKRRRGCIYRSSLFSNVAEAPKLNPAERFYRTFMPTVNGVRCIGYARRRMGRGGRIIFDRILHSPPSTSQSAPDPLFCSVIDTTKTYQCKLVNAGNNNNSSSDSDEDHKGKDEDDELEYRRREELYARRIFGMSGVDPAQRLPAGANSRGVSSQDSNDDIVVLGEESSGSISGNEQSVLSINGVHETGRFVNFQQNGPPLDMHGGPLGDCGLQPVLLTASMAGKVEKVSQLPNSSVNYQQKRVPDHSLRIFSQIATTEISEATPVFYTHLPPPAVQSVGLMGTGEQAVHHASRTSDYTSNSSVNPTQTLVVTTAQPIRQQDRLERQAALMSSQEFIINAPNVKLRASGRRRSINSSAIAQLALSAARPETNLQRMNTYGLNGDIVAQASSCVDTKRLELAIKGSGARIKPAQVVAQPVLQPYSTETKTLRDLLLGSAVPTNKAVSNTMVTNKATLNTATTMAARAYAAPQYVPVVGGDTRRYVPYSNLVTTSSYYLPVTDVAPSLGSNNMPQQTSQLLSPAVQNQSGRSCLGISETKIQTPVAVVSNRPSLNGAQVDAKYGASNKTANGGRKCEAFIATSQADSDLQPHATSSRCVSSSSPLHATGSTGKQPEGSAVKTGTGNSSTATVPAAVLVKNEYSQPAVEDAINKRVANSHNDIAACHGVINYVIN